MAARGIQRHIMNSVTKHGKTRGGIQRTLRSPLVAVKMGMTSAWDDNGAIHPITLLQVQQCQVVQVKTEDSDGYFAMQVGAASKHPKRLSKAELCHFQKHNALPKKRLFEFRVTEDALLPPGSELSARHFVPGQFVDVTGISIGKGFQGVMKRWGFAGQPASHGHSLSHRSAGSLGGLTHCGRVFKGKKMAGHMGAKQVTVLGLLVYHVDPLNNIIGIRGCIPGHVNNFVRIRDAVRLAHHKHNMQLGLPIPTAGEVAEEDQEAAMALQTTPTALLKNPLAYREE